jgi:hypothetical protein
MAAAGVSGRRAPFGAAILFLTATTGVAFAAVAMRPSSALAAAILMAIGFAAHVLGARPH